MRILLPPKVIFSDPVLVGLDCPQGTINGGSTGGKEKNLKNRIDILGRSAVSPRTLRELPRASLLTRRLNHDFQCSNINYIKEIGMLHQQNADNSQAVHNRDFNFTKEISTLHCQKRDNYQGVQNRDLFFTKDISTLHCQKRDNYQTNKL